MKRILGMAILTTTLLVGCSTKEIIIQPNAPLTFVAKQERRGDYSFVIPSNFQLVDSESFIYEIGSVYRAYLLYKGEGFVKDLLKFFDTNMEKSGWKKESVVIGRDAILAYSKEGQMIVLKISYGVTNTYIKVLLIK
ncbi:MAG: hypothetical protein N2Z80_04960 [Hydrogenothermaceae bacterium]|nr:hypothetical protein [Hydrogenothermaceae bacterium]